MLPKNTTESSNEIQLQVAELNDQNVASVSLLVARFMPFYTYSFGLMLEKIVDQLRHRTNICVLREGRIVAYAGWIEVDEQEIQQWYQGSGNLPNPAWSSDHPVVITILVTPEARFLKDIRRGMSKLCNGRRVYGERVGRIAGRAALRRSILFKSVTPDSSS